jgi:hypothetical protein
MWSSTSAPPICLRVFNVGIFTFYVYSCRRESKYLTDGKVIHKRGC